MRIWFNKNLTLADFQAIGKDTMGGHIGIRFSELGDNHLSGTMPVDHRTKQPYGLLHGGASVTLAETLGSVGSALVVDPAHFFCVGQEINANHIRSVRSGQVTGTAAPVHLGATSHVWEIKIHDEQGKLVCVSRLTVAILQKR